MILSSRAYARSSAISISAIGPSVRKPSVRFRSAANDRASLVRWQVNEILLSVHKVLKDLDLE
jgi:hypothetical protein